MGLRVGSKVEVCSIEEGYGGAWFECMILGRNGKRGHHYCWKVQFEKFVTENGEPLVETVSSTQIRPNPPEVPLPEEIWVGDWVEAYDRDCWWRGIVLRVQSRAENGSQALFLVYFPDTRTFKAYPRSDLRVGQEWIHRKWRRYLLERRSPQTSETIPAIASPDRNPPNPLRDNFQRNNQVNGRSRIQTRRRKPRNRVSARSLSNVTQRHTRKRRRTSKNRQIRILSNATQIRRSTRLTKRKKSMQKILSKSRQKPEPTLAALDKASQKQNLSVVQRERTWRMIRRSLKREAQSLQDGEGPSSKRSKTIHLCPARGRSFEMNACTQVSNIFPETGSR